MKTKVKMILGVIFVALLVGSYFLYNYQKEAILEKKRNAGKENTDTGESPLSEDAVKMVYDFWKYTGKDTIQAGNSNIQVMGEEKKLPEKITTMQFYKNEEGSFLSLAEAYYFYGDKAVSFTYLDENLIVYYGDNGVGQNLVDTARMSKDFDFLTRYNAEGKPEIKAEYKEKSYKLD